MRPRLPGTSDLTGHGGDSVAAPTPKYRLPVSQSLSPTGARFGRSLALPRSAILFIVLLVLPTGIARSQPAPGPTAAKDTENRLKDATSKGLHWLAARQNERGQFVGPNEKVSKDVAVTALSGLAFLASGSEPGKGGYAKQLRGAVESVLASQRPSGLFTEGAAQGPMYGHGYATLFLAEVYRKHPDDAVKSALQRSVALLEKSVNKEGGWRYSPRPLDADISVTACELNALLATHAAGIAVDDKLIANAIQYVHHCQNPDGGFSYMAGQGIGSGFPRSAAGVVVLLHSGVKPADDADLKRATDYLTRMLGAPSTGHYFYGRYYLSQSLITDPAARERQDALTRELLDAQQPDGSWKDEFSSVYGTASALIILQAPQKHLWIFSSP